jgi:hypothetical protein
MNFGFPGETASEMNATIELAIRLNPTYAAFHLIVPFPGTSTGPANGAGCGGTFPPISIPISISLTMISKH